jgi:hypothetical protein
LIKAYLDNREKSNICNIIINPSKIDSKTLNTVNYNYRATLHQSQIVIEDDMLIFNKQIQGGSSYTSLQLIPMEFYNIIFVAFHSNAIGGQLNTYHTLHHICLHYYWPGMYSYIKKLCSPCPSCAFANPIKREYSELVYNFPIEVPFLFLFVYAYSARKHSSFDGLKHIWLHAVV